MAICLFSMAGVPPLMGFFAKYAVLYTAIHNGFYFISLVAIVTSVISASYYLRIIRVLYFDEISAGSSSQTPGVLTNAHSYVIAVLTLFIVFFVLEPSIILNSTQLMAISIYGF